MVSSPLGDAGVRSEEAHDDTDLSGRVEHMCSFTWILSTSMVLTPDRVIEEDLS